MSGSSLDCLRGNSMSNCKDNNMQEGLRRLQKAQLAVGQSAFHAINEHDKLMRLLQELLAEADEMFGSMDIINMEITSMLAESGITDEQRENFSQMNDQNAIMTGRLLDRLQGILVEAEVGSQTIHKMEEDIAMAQDAVDLLRETTEFLI